MEPEAVSTTDPEASASQRVGKACTPEEKAALLAARTARSRAIYLALMLALNAGLRDAEIRGLQWGRIDLFKAYLTVGVSKTEAGEGRTIPLNSDLLEAMVEYSKGYTRRFHTMKPGWGEIRMVSPQESPQSTG